MTSHPATVVDRGTFAAILRWVGRITSLGEKTVAPLVDLIIRVLIAKTFLVSAIIKLSDWDNALALARDEYPVSWMDPVSAATIAVSIELLGASLLAVGLATRGAALALAALALVIQFNYIVLDTHLFWVALLGWFIVRGAGPISLDANLARGLAASALPFAAPILRGLHAFSAGAKPLYLLLVRLWLGLAVLAAAGFGNLSPLLFPMRSADVGTLVLACAFVCAIGFGARFAAALWIVALVASGSIDATFAIPWYWAAALAMIVLHGAGELSLDHLTKDFLAARYPELEGTPAYPLDRLPRVVIVGAGFGGLACAAKLAQAPVQITLVDRHNYHLFQPLLYQVATAALAPGDIAASVRSVFRDAANVRVLLGTVNGVDPAEQFVSLDSGQRIPYDYLVVATGASHSYFGRDDWAPYAPGLKRVEDATEVRRRILIAFEKAEAVDDPDERQSLLTFLIVGGGPTGVELAGAIAELARLGMDKEFRRFDPAAARVLLVQSGPRLLPAFPEKLSAVTQRSLEQLGVEVHLNSKVEAIDALGVSVSGRRIAARTVLWAAGVVASPAAKWLHAEHDNAGRLKVEADLSLAHHPNVFAIGDTALSNAWQGKPVPGLAPAAKQGGLHVASVIWARVLGRRMPPPFRYRHLGSLATIGRKAAVADFGFVRLTGALAWWLWGLLHVGFLVGVRNKVSVMFDWFWAYLTFSSSTRLITGTAGPDHVESVAAIVTSRVQSKAA
ncbi:MAG: FAD-dependent oxidoreductase [Burkholderiales bacterium]